MVSVTDNLTPVLLLRGLTREQRHWGRFSPLLAEKLTNPVLGFDFAGSGELYQQRSPSTVNALRQSVRSQLLSHPAFNGKVHLVALSLGGMMAGDWALAFPEEVASVTLINSSARPLAPFYQRLRWRIYPALARLLWLSASAREQCILQLTTAQAHQDPQLVCQWQRWQQQRPVSAANALRQLLAASRFRLSAKPDCRILIISSQGDKLVNPQCSVALANYLQAAHQRHSWAGHDIALDDPLWLAGQISQFIQQL
ncbi:MAG: alpha/beta hydrolase [Rheinheimera sp.]|uniref:alpha/beta fold hydrolase n=1 Tax=Arsukibacterium sp. UBA3155 TaxID=1946058 RepID=UPI000C92DDAB|nr:alpha/beta hydrolase [Arsukibacterium sp. UBA3155]MAD77653.1 alpha/beta hydrolase [Rheinheimera sp.]|tara:strand:+ start:13710 stop:14474 length:765 start_codon:yes stop_codon:yes gene_type:complete